MIVRDITAGYAFAINTKRFGKRRKFPLRAYDKAGNDHTTATRTWKR